jgi:hypothetical protein
MEQERGGCVERVAASARLLRGQLGHDPEARIQQRRHALPAQAPAAHRHGHAQRVHRVHAGRACGQRLC